jgi:hypothetical protein
MSYDVHKCLVLCAISNFYKYGWFLVKSEVSTFLFDRINSNLKLHSFFFFTVSRKHLYKNL